MQKLDKDKLYYVGFTHCLDNNDKIFQTVTGRKFFRIRNFLSDLGYEVKSIEEITL